VWVGDVTFIATRTGWLYLAIMMDLYSRKIIGWSMSKSNDKQLVLSALAMAVARRQPKSGVLHHTDRVLSIRQTNIAKDCLRIICIQHE